MRALSLVLAVSFIVVACGDTSTSATSGPDVQPAADGSGSPSADASSGESSASSPPPMLGSGLGAYPVDASPVTKGGTMTFTNVGAPGFWPRRIVRPAGDPACDWKDGTDTWGGRCCQKKQYTTSDRLAPFDEEMTLILKAVDVKQVAVYQPHAGTDGRWGLVSAWDRRSRIGQNLGFTRGRDQELESDGALHTSDCVWYLAQPSPFSCGDGRDYYCPDDPGMKRLGWTGSKLFVVLTSMTFDDADVKACNGGGDAHPGPWVALVASELVRDGARKWNGACNCYSKTGSVGDGCGEMNLFEVVMDENPYSNREFASTGVRSYQAGHVGGNVCGTGCSPSDFPPDAEVVDACAKKPYTRGAEIPVGGKADGCPVWRRPKGDRYLVVLLDETTRTVQVSVVHPQNIPAAIAALLPGIPAALERTTIDSLVSLRLPSGN